MTDQPAERPPARLLGLIADARSQIEHASLPTGPRPDAIRGYELLRELHRGGQGVVYLAHQQATRRDVAIKVLRDGPFAGTGDRARFEREVQILASLKHPNIVAIHDSGSVAGNFYFVMDYIRGLPLDEWADQLRHGDLSGRSSSHGSRRRHEKLLSLFIKICDAINVAHQRGIIHRDLKPTNILVTPAGEPSVLDFGLAKRTATDASTIKATALTATGQFLGTLPWASPEQVESDSYHADIRTDVYAVGLMLYRALTGRMPYKPGRSVPEMIRVITEVEPSRPRSLVTDLDVDLETVVLKCLSKDPERRYQTVDQLAEDLQRYLRYEPIGARRESGWYLLRMFARRHRAAVAAAAGFVAILCAASISLAYLYARAKSSERLALRIAEFQATQLSGVDSSMMGARLRDDLLTRSQQLAEAQGKSNAEVARQSQELERLIAGVNFTDLALHALDSSVFEQAMRAIDKQFAEQPLVQAELLQTVARTMRQLGLLERASAPQRAALEIRRATLGDEHPATLESVNQLGELLRLRGQLSAAMPYVREALEARQRTLGEEHPDTLTSMNTMGGLLQQLGRLDESLALRRAAMVIHRRTLGDDHIATIKIINDMGTLLVELGQFYDALPLFLEALEGLRRATGEESPETLATLSNLGHLYTRLGRFDEAMTCFAEALETRRRVLGNEHASTLNSIDSMAELVQKQGRFAEAMVLRKEALAGYQRLLGPDHPDTLRSVNGMNSLLLRMGRLDEAQVSVPAGLADHRRILGNQHQQTIIALNLMSNLLRSQGKLEEAVPLATEVWETSRQLLGDEHTNTITAALNLGGLLKSTGQLDEALRCYQQVFEKSRQVWGEQHHVTLTAAYSMGSAMWALDRFDEALPYFEQALAGYTSQLGPDHVKTLTAIISIGSVFKSMGRYDEAASRLEEGLDGYRRQLGDEHHLTLRALNLLGELRVAQQQRAAARECFVEAMSTGRRVLGDEHPETLRALTNMGNLLRLEGDLDQAEPLLQEAAAGLELLATKHALRQRVAEHMVAFYEARTRLTSDGADEQQLAQWRATLEGDQTPVP